MLGWYRFEKLFFSTERRIFKMTRSATASRADGHLDVVLAGKGEPTAVEVVIEAVLTLLGDSVPGCCLCSAE